ncbi:MAG: 50S ribosomal protein L36 [Candidatus Dojkabacteria bacterium]|nr:50S ribosomal protein L36 [Candidatus Dojkabacteria bacterium]
MKVKSSIKPRCKDCYVVVRSKKTRTKNGQVITKRVCYIYCKSNRKHKQRQG